MQRSKLELFKKKDECKKNDFVKGRVNCRKIGDYIFYYTNNK